MYWMEIRAKTSDSSNILKAWSKGLYVDEDYEARNIRHQRGMEKLPMVALKYLGFVQSKVPWTKSRPI